MPLWSTSNRSLKVWSKDLIEPTKISLNLSPPGNHAISLLSCDKKLLQPQAKSIIWTRTAVYRIKRIQENKELVRKKYGWIQMLWFWSEFCMKYDVFSAYMATFFIYQNFLCSYKMFSISEGYNVTILIKIHQISSKTAHTDKVTL